MVTSPQYLQQATPGFGMGQSPYTDVYNPTGFGYANDPLRVSAYTGNQMGYMPQAQFLTPASYGAFRTTPGPQMQNMPYQDMGMMESLAAAHTIGQPNGPASLFYRYNPTVNQAQQLAIARRNVNDSMGAIKMGALDFAFNAGTSSLLGGALGSSIAGGLGLANATATLPLLGQVSAAGMLGFGMSIPIAMALPALTAGYTDRVRQARAIQNMSMAKIVAGPEMDYGMGSGFTGAAAVKIDRNLRHMAANDALFKEGDYRKLLEVGLESGMFDYAGTSDQYINNLKKLRHVMSGIMDVVGSSDFKDLCRETKRLQDMGADMNQFTSIMRQEQGFARMAGLSHADMTGQYGQSGALAYSQHGLDAYRGALQEMSNVGALTIMQRKGLISPDTLARMGGISGAAQTLTASQSAAEAKMQMPLVAALANSNGTGLDKDRLDSLIVALNRGTLDLNKLISQGGRFKDAESILNLQANSGGIMNDITKQLGGQAGMELFTASLAQAIGKVMGGKGVQGQLMMGYSAMGFDPLAAQMQTKKMLSEEFKEQLRITERNRDLQAREEYRDAMSISSQLSKWFRNFGNSLGDALFGKAAASTVQNTDEGSAKSNLPRLGAGAQGLPYYPGSGDKGGTSSKGRSKEVDQPIIRHGLPNFNVDSEVVFKHNPTFIQDKEKWEKIRKGLLQAAMDAGVSPELLFTKMMAETGGNPLAKPEDPTQSARGLFQMIDGTRKDMRAYVLRNYKGVMEHSQYELLEKASTDKELLNLMLSNPYISGMMAAAYTDITRNTLEEHDLDPDLWVNNYALDLLGHGGGIAFLKAVKSNPNEITKDMYYNKKDPKYFSRVAEANKEIFYHYTRGSDGKPIWGKPRTNQEIYNILKNKGDINLVMVPDIRKGVKPPQREEDNLPQASSVYDFNLTKEVLSTIPSSSWRKEATLLFAYKTLLDPNEQNKTYTKGETIALANALADAGINIQDIAKYFSDNKLTLDNASPELLARHIREKTNIDEKKLRPIIEAHLPAFYRYALEQKNKNGEYVSQELRDLLSTMGLETSSTELYNRAKLKGKLSVSDIGLFEHSGSTVSNRVGVLDALTKGDNRAVILAPAAVGYEELRRLGKGDEPQIPSDEDIGNLSSHLIKMLGDYSDNYKKDPSKFTENLKTALKEGALNGPHSNFSDILNMFGIKEFSNFTLLDDINARAGIGAIPDTKMYFSRLNYLFSNLMTRAKKVALSDTYSADAMAMSILSNYADTMPGREHKGFTESDLQSKEFDIAFRDHLRMSGAAPYYEQIWTKLKAISDPKLSEKDRIDQANILRDLIVNKLLFVDQSSTKTNRTSKSSYGSVEEFFTAYNVKLSQTMTDMTKLIDRVDKFMKDHA